MITPARIFGHEDERGRHSFRPCAAQPGFVPKTTGFIVLAIPAVRPAYGQEITARLRDQGFSDIVEGTVHALLVRQGAVPAALPDRDRRTRTLFHVTGSIVKGDVLLQMLEELADLIERGALDGTPLRDIVGDEPVEFADTFIRNYSDGQWINKERKRLTDAIDQAAGDDA